MFLVYKFHSCKLLFYTHFTKVETGSVMSKEGK